MAPVLWDVRRAGEEGWTVKNGRGVLGEGPRGGRGERWE